MMVRRDLFYEHIATLRKRYRFLNWSEYKEALQHPSEAKHCVLLTFDDGFQSSWSALSDLAAKHEIPALFFVNTSALDNACAPWHVQYQFLRSQSGQELLEPLWKSISDGKPLLPPMARKRMHECFSLRNVVEPLEEGMAKAGMSPAELAQQYQLYVSSSEIRQGNDLIEIGNHSHSHYILSKLTPPELDEDLRTSHRILHNLKHREPEAFAYPFGIPGEHFNLACANALRRLAPYPYIFSATDTSLQSDSVPGELGRICLDKVPLSQAIGSTAKVTPRGLKKWLLAQ
jgi:peptidoglycan/xylan/chitin deacetylase (PgdA/CDA1 family)